MRIAFYAPLKPPDHPVPSGDRQIARLLMKALASAGHQASLVSRFRTFDGRGDAPRQVRMRSVGKRIAKRLVARLTPESAPHAWFTYHVHHKAPDLLGREVSRALGIPYVIAEASVAPRRRDGPWAVGYADALAAIQAADTIVSLNPADAGGVAAARGQGAALDDISPFIDVAEFAAPTQWTGRERRQPGSFTRLVTVAMMREGPKLASYRVLASALAQLCDLPWSMRIIGDGPARNEVQRAFDGVGDRVAFVGVRSAAEIALELARSDLFLWPAIDEAFGVAFLEAQACGVPVVGACTPGVAAVVAKGRTGVLVPPDDVGAFASAARDLIVDRALRSKMSVAAKAYVRAGHDLPLAAARLDAILRRVVARRAVAR